MTDSRWKTAWGDKRSQEINGTERVAPFSAIKDVSASLDRAKREAY